MAETLLKKKARPVLTRVFTDHRFLMLFVFLLATLIAYPYTENRAFGLYAFRVMSGAIIALSVYAVSFRRGLAIVALLLAIPAAVQHLLDPSLAAGFFPAGQPHTQLGLRRLDCGGDFSARVCQRPDHFGNHLRCAVYLSSEWDELRQHLRSGGRPAAHAFLLDPAVNRHTIPDRFDCIYYSFGMMTQLGAAGIIAVSDQARSISVIEAILGQLYLAVLISRLVAAYRFRPSTADS